MDGRPEICWHQPPLTVRYISWMRYNGAKPALRVDLPAAQGTAQPRRYFRWMKDQATS